MVELIIAKSVIDPAFFIDIQEDFQYIEKTNIHHNIFVSMKRFFDKFTRMPNYEELRFSLFDELIESEKKFVGDYDQVLGMVYNVIPTAQSVACEILRGKVKEEATRQRISIALVKAAESFQTTSTQDIIDNLKSIVFKTEPVGNREEFYFNEVQENIHRLRYNPTSKVSCNIRSLDNILHGGFGRKELVTFMAPPGRGKSVMLSNINFGMMVGGHKTWYITLETSADMTLQRTYRRALLKDKDYIRDVDNEFSIVDNMVKFYNSTKAVAKLNYYPANTFAIEDLRAELTKMRMVGDFFPDVIILDHLDLLTTKDKRILSKSEAAYWRYIVDGLRAIAVDFDIAIATATQTNRGAVNKDIITQEDMGESFGKVQSSDVVISLNQTDEEKDNKRMRLYTAKNRDFVAGMITELYCNLDFMAIMDIDDAQSYGILYTPAETKAMAGLMQSFDSENS